MNFYAKTNTCDQKLGLRELNRFPAGWWCKIHTGGWWKFTRGL